MSDGFGIPGQGTNPLAYTDRRYATMPTVEFNRDPGEGDNTYPIQTVALNNVTKDEWILVSYEPFNKAQWVKFAGTGLNADTACSNYIVDSTYPLSSSKADYATIQEAIAAASSGDTVFIKPGTYTEDLTLKAGVNLVSFITEPLTAQVEIIGKLTVTDTGDYNISGIRLTTSSDFALEVTGANLLNIILENCYINSLDNTAVSYSNSNASSSLRVFRCRAIGASGNLFIAWSGAGVFTSYYSFWAGSSGVTASTFSAGSIQIKYTESTIPITLSGSASLSMFQCNFNTQGLSLTPVTSNSTSGTRTINGSSLNGGTEPALTIGASSSVTITQTNIFSSNATAAIDGAGTLNYAGLTFSGSSSAITTTTQVPLPTGPDIVVPGSITVGETVQDNIFTVNGASITSAIAQHTSGASDLGGFVSERHSTTPAFGAHSLFLRTKGDEATPDVVADNDVISRLVSCGYDGTDFAQCAEIRVEVDGTPGDDDMPGRILWMTSVDGAQTPIEGIRLDSAQVVTLANALPAGSGGTGASTLTGVLTGNGTSAFTASAVTDNTVVMGSTSNLLQDTTITVTDAGEMVNTLQPAFNAYVGTNILNVTGDGTLYTIIFNTERFDQNSDYNTTTGTFTAPVTGRYQFNVCLRIAYPTTQTIASLFLTTSNEQYLFYDVDGNAVKTSNSNLALSAGMLVDMDAADTAILQLQVQGASLDVDILANLSHFSGNLSC